MYGHREYRLFNLDHTNTLPFVNSPPCQCGSAYRFSRLTYLTGGAPILTRPPRGTWESTHFIFSSKSSKFSGTSWLGFSGYHLAKRLFYHVLSIAHLSAKSNPRARGKSQLLKIHIKQEVKPCRPMRQVKRCGWHWLLLQLHLLISGGNLMLNDHVLQKRSKVKISGKSC